MRISAWMPGVAMLAFVLTCTAANQPKSAAHQRLDTIMESARAAHTRGDAEAYLAKSKEMRALLNGTADGVLQQMSAEAFAGDQDAALRSFEELIAMGQSNDAALQAKQFDELRKTEKFSALEAQMRKNDAAIATGTEVFRMPEAGLIAEDVDYDSATKRFYVTSVLKNEILALDEKGAARVFARAPDAWPMMALKIDSARRLLWVTEVALRPFKSVKEADWGTSAILIYDLDSGRLVHRVAGPPKTVLGDMTLTKEGDAIVSDNDEGAIYRVNGKTFAVERLDEGDFISPQTPVMSPDNQHVFVPDYTRGVAVLDLATKHASWLSSDGTHALNGIDGLYLYGRTLIATQNGTSPERVVRFELDKTLTKVESETIIERGTPTLGDPTHGVVVGGAFYYIANSGWDAIEEDGSPKAGTTPSKSLLMRADLGSKAH